MKKKKLLKVVLASALLAGGFSAIVACTPSDTPAVVTEFKVTHDLSDDYQITGLKSSYKEGDTVTFKVNVLNNLKQISSVRAGTKTLKADSEGNYSFTMGNADVALKVSLINKTQPVLALNLEGKKEVGATLVASVTADGKALSQYTLSATKGANLITISGSNITLNAAGDVTLKAVATVDVFENLETTVSFTIAESESQLGLNVAYDEGVAMPGAESAVGQHLGQWLYWAGDGGVADYLNFSNGQYDFSFTTGWAWYGVQLFYRTPSLENGDAFSLRWDVESNAAGTITLSGQKVDLVQGQNTIALSLTQGAAATISIQFGINGGAGTDFTGTSFKFTAPRIYDANPEHKYHEVKFTADNALLKDIQVREGKTVAAPEAPKKDNFVFDCYKDGETVYSETLAITKAYNFDAKYVEKSAENIRTIILMNGETKLGEFEVAVNSKFVLPSNIDVGFGHKINGIFRDAAFITAYDMNAAVTENLTLYARVSIGFDTWINSAEAGYAAPASWFTYGNDGSVTASFAGWGSDQGWHIQFNFYNLPMGESTDTYRVKFSYTMSHEGGRYQIYDGNTVQGTDGELQVGGKKDVEFTYAGDMVSTKDRKLTFELGAIEKDAPVVFTLHSFELVKVA